MLDLLDELLLEMGTGLSRTPDELKLLLLLDGKDFLHKRSEFDHL